MAASSSTNDQRAKKKAPEPLTLATAPDWPSLLRDRIGDRPQWKVAEEIGVSQSRVSRWLTGGLPDADKIGLVAVWLGVTEGELFTFLRAHHRRAPRRSMGERLADLEVAMAAMMTEMEALSLRTEAFMAAWRPPAKRPQPGDPK
jgi:transcriptional regulator with XRE-family HTH domain